MSTSTRRKQLPLALPAAPVVAEYIPPGVRSAPATATHVRARSSAGGRVTYAEIDAENVSPEVAGKLLAAVIRRILR